jgi:hypothetical protein
MKLGDFIMGILAILIFTLAAFDLMGGRFDRTTFTVVWAHNDSN